MMRFACLWLCTLTCAASAFAAESKADEAKRHFARSRELYDDGDFAGALNELERSYKTSPNFRLLFNIGQIQAQLQNYAGALKTFRRFLLDGGPDVSETRRAEVLKDIDKFRTRVAELTIICAEGAEITLDDVPLGKSPLSESVIVNVGRRKVTATLANHFPSTKWVEVVGLEMLNVKLDLQPVVATKSQTSSPVETRAEPSAARLPLWVPWVGTGALAAATTVMGLVSLQSSSAQSALLRSYGVTRAQLDAASSKTRGQALATDILLGSTAAAAVASLLYTLLREPEPTSPSVSLGVSMNSLVLSGSF